VPSAHAPAPDLVVTEPSIGTILDQRLVHPLFQPIVDLDTRAVVGVEALARGPAGTALELPDQLFAAARAAGRLGELDMLCGERALECALEAPETPPLVFINAEPAVLDQPVSDRLLSLLARVRFRTVLEFTERALPAVPSSLLHIAAQVQQWDNSLALDDVGVDPMSLAFLPVLEPEIVKLDMSLIREPDAPHTRTVCTVVRSEAHRTAAIVVAEGIETEDDLRTARSLGAQWGQGWLFGRPAPIQQAGHRYLAGAASLVRAARPGFHQPDGTPFRIAARTAAAGPATAATVAAALDDLRRTIRAGDSAVVVAVCPDGAIPGLAGSLDELLGCTRSVILIDRPIPDEFAAVVIGPGYGQALCLRSRPSAELITVRDLPAVAAVTRVLLNRNARPQP
jgi:EAL domain-containing protein (putative c-di-GMP-specific phosphodiesterase class I)